MVEPKVSLSMLVRGAKILSSQECDENPKENYNEESIVIDLPKGKKKTIVFKTRKQGLITHNINLCKEAYTSMLSTPTDPKFAKPIKHNKKSEVIQRVWDKMTENERLKKHFDLIAHDFNAVSYTFKVLDD